MLHRSMLLVALSLIAAPTLALEEYHLEDLGTLGGETSAALTMNEAGQVAGWAGEAPQGFLWTEGVLRPVVVPGFGSSHNTVLQAINSSRHPRMAGASLSGQAYWVDDLQNSALIPRLPGGQMNFATSINDRGEVVGSSMTQVRTISHAYWYTLADANRPERGFTVKDLGTLGGRESSALAINNASQIVGAAHTANGAWHACLWQGSRKTDLGTLGGGTSTATALNQAGSIVGYSLTAKGESHAFLWRTNRMTDLGTLPDCTMSAAYGINSRDQVVGVSCPDGDEEHERAFLWTAEEGMQDLNTALFERLGWRLRQARSINSRGQIAGWGTRNGKLRAFRLTPEAAPPAPVVEEPEQGPAESPGIPGVAPGFTGSEARRF